MGLLATAAVMLVAAMPSSAWSGSDASYTARDNVGGAGGPTNQYSTYDALSGWTCVALADDDWTADLVAAYPSLSFQFYGTVVPGIHADSNGYIAFRSGTGQNGLYVASTFPSGGSPNPAIAGYWSDLRPNLGGTVCYQLFSSGTSSERLAVQYENVRFPTGTDTTTFLILLHENGNVAEVHYGATGGADGSSDSVGIQNMGGSVGIPYKSGTGVSTTSEAVQYRPKTSFPLAQDNTYALDYCAYGGKIILDGAVHGSQP